MPIKREIIYPFFLECCSYAKDTFWETVFEDLAYGITPYGTYINNDLLCCSYKNKEFSYKLERKDPKTLYEDLYRLLSVKAGILSQRDKQKKRLEFHNVGKDIRESRQKWSDIRKKNVRDLLIEKYVISLQNKHSLTIKQARYLLSVITIALVSKVITSKDINYKDGKILHIDGIEIKDGKAILTKDIYDTNTDYSIKEEEIPENKLSSHWDKYLKQLQKETRF